MQHKLFKIKNKLPGLSYAFTENGIELPVLDITNPFFISSIDENKLNKMLAFVEKNAERNARKFQRTPNFIKSYFAKHSFAMAELMQGEASFATGISTLMMKLGPHLIGKGRKRFWDRQVTNGFGALVLRMRARDISKCQADFLIPLLKKYADKNLCFINLAGGAAADTINALFLILEENAALLKDRKIEINVLDIDTYGPAFARRCIEALKLPSGKFHDLDLSFRHIEYDWNSTQKLVDLLKSRKDFLILLSSEGGIFEYCNDDVIVKNLNAAYDNSPGDIVIVGTLLHDIGKVDAGIKAALKISTNIKPRFLGLDGLKNIIERIEPNKWKIHKIIEGNPRYLIFSLIKK